MTAQQRPTCAGGSVPHITAEEHADAIQHITQQQAFALDLMQATENIKPLPVIHVEAKKALDFYEMLRNAVNYQRTVWAARE